MMVLLMTGFLSSACLKTIAASFPIEFRAEYVENNKSSIPQQEADALYQSMGVALSSYEYWTNKYGGTTNEE